MQLTKEEPLSFIEFLSQREITIVPFTRTKFSFFNGRHTIDSTDEVRRMAEFVKTHSPEESYRQGLSLIKEYEPNCNHTLMPELVYREGLEEYMV
ncbi:MAG: hypothetical protein HUJ75_06840 [Parasporobacterium sp.]|nr:hypothetical protein [Parasporobacterium sp.]